ncbi:MAG: RMD1 family protein [Gammaproteobacteria bacterium]|nr:RMD1 family protein [Gammaproteobacteria bacterium]
MPESFFPSQSRIQARALFVGERIDVRAFEGAERVAESPLLVRAGSRGCAALFRYGAVVLFEMQPLEQVSFLGQLAPLVSGAIAQPESEDVELTVSAGGDERVDPSGGISLTDTSVERLQLVAEVLAKSVVLAHYERQVAKVFDSIEPLAAGLRQAGRVGSQARELLRQIGDVLMVEHKMVGRVEVAEKPDLLWDHPLLERFYARLVDEYELTERHRALDQKLELIARTAETVLDLLQHRRSLRVEWYIVILIVVEIFLSLYELFIAR